jgi:CRP-like cAMP-binding protein
VLVVGRGLARLSQLSPEGRENVLAYLGRAMCLNLSAALDGASIWLRRMRRPKR